MILVGKWWTFVLRGVFAVLFGLLTFLLPGMALLTFIFLFSAYSIADGVVNLIGAFRRTGAGPQPWWALLISGLLGIVAGLIAFLMPGLTALVLLYIIAGWAIATGVMGIIAAIRLRKQLSGEFFLVLSGALSIIFGVLLFIFPGAGALALVYWIGAYAVVFGVLLIALGFRLRKWIRSAETQMGGGFPAVAN